MTRDDRREFLKILHAHEQTIAVCEACANTTRQLAAEVARGGVPPRADLIQTMEEADRAIVDLTAVREEVRRLITELT